MRRSVIILFIAAVCLQFSAAEEKAKQPKFGMGIYAGDPEGISFKFWLTKKYALCLAVGWQGRERTYFHMDYLVHNYSAVTKGDLTGEVPFYYGVGVRADRLFDPLGAMTSGIRGVLGVSYIFKEMPADFFAELAPTMILGDNATGLLAVGLGARYYFE